MPQVRLGKTGITVKKNGFGALPVQRVDMAEAKRILRHAYDNGITYFDTARAYSDSEEKIGEALSDVRSHIYVATKTMATTAGGFWKDLETSLRNLQTDYVDIIQFHNPAFCPTPGDESGLYDAARDAQRKGLVRFIGITNHRLNVAQQALDSGLYATLQFPFNYITGAQELALVERCKAEDVGFIAMKGLSGGLLNDAATCYNWMCQWDNVLPIWGVQTLEELQQFLDCEKGDAQLTPAQLAKIEEDRASLQGEFCRGCGYCMPCPKDIEINNAARMSLMLRRAPPVAWLTEEWQAKMQKIEDCIDCRQCVAKCPYNLDTPALLRRNFEDYKTFL